MSEARRLRCPPDIVIRDTSAQDRPLSKQAVSRPWRRWISAGGSVLAALTGGSMLVRSWLSAQRSIDRSRLRIARVERGPLVRDIVADGRVVAASSPTLYAIAAGTVELHVRAGDQVKKGQSLATISSPELQSKLLQEQATLAGLEAGVGRAGLDVEHGRANADKLIAQAELERQAAALEITSPVDGQVGQLLVAQRQSVMANAPVLTVVDLGAFELELKVPDSFARDLALGMGAELRSGSQTFPARVRSVSPEVVDGNVATRLEFANERPAGLRQNQRLTARILLEERADVLKVERGPFLETGGGNSAYFIEDGMAEKRPIRVGAVSLDAVEVTAGAQVGDQIVITGADTFDNAQRVRIAN